MALKLLDKKYYIDESFTIRRVKNGGYMNEKVHTHDFVELIYVYDGRSCHKVDGIEYSLGRGDLLFVNYGSRHSFETGGNLEYVNIILKPDFISRSLKGEKNVFSLLTLSSFNEFSDKVNRAKQFMHFSKDERIRIEALISLMEDEESHNNGSDFVLRSALNVFLAIVFRKMSFSLSEQLEMNSELLVYIRDNCGEKLPLKNIAAKCSYNPSYFSRAFKKFAGMSYLDFLSKCRLEKACELLSMTDKTIEEIITECGFSDRTRFFKLFCDEIGSTPMQYRKIKYDILTNR